MQVRAGASSFLRATSRAQTGRDELRIAAVAFESQESLIYDTDGVILRINPAFTRDTGYTAAEAVGQTPRLFKSDATMRFYADWRLCFGPEHGGRNMDRRKMAKFIQNGSPSPSSRLKRQCHHYVGHTPILRKQGAEEESRVCVLRSTHSTANDAADGRLKQALASSARSGREGALLFIDLDNSRHSTTPRSRHRRLAAEQVALRLESCIREATPWRAWR